MQLPPFDTSGCLPPGDYRLTFAELRESMLVLGPGDPAEWPNGDAGWRSYLVENAMIRNESEYQEATRRLSDEQKRLEALVDRLRKEGRTEAEIKRVTDPMWSFHLQLSEELESYERLCRGQFSEIENLHGLGRLLIGVRIARSMSQRELAEKLGIHESQVSRDERNEYHGITVGRAARILDALDVRLTSHVEFDVESK